MRRLRAATLSFALFLSFGVLVAQASVETRTWPASDKAKRFVKDTIVIGFFASPSGVGWTEDKHLHDYLVRSRDAGITGHSMTLTAGTHTWENLLAVVVHRIQNAQSKP